MEYKYGILQMDYLPSKEELERARAEYKAYLARRHREIETERGKERPHGKL